MNIDSRVDDYVVRENGDVVVSRRFYERDYGDAKEAVKEQLVMSYRDDSNNLVMVGKAKRNENGLEVPADSRTRRKPPSILMNLPPDTETDDRPLWRVMGDTYQATDFNRPSSRGLNSDGREGDTFGSYFNVGFITSASTIDIYDRNGKYKKGWLFLAQQMHSPRDIGYVGGPHNYDNFHTVYPVDGTLGGILTANPYIYDTIIGPYQTSNSHDLDIKGKMWRKLLSILNEGTEGNNSGLQYTQDGRYEIPDEGDQVVTDPAHSIRLLYGDYLNRGPFPSTYNGLIMTSIISHYHKDDTDEDMVKQSRYILPVDMGVFTKTIDARYDALYKVVTGSRMAPQVIGVESEEVEDVGENFCQDRDILLFQRPIELTREKDNTVIFNKLGMEYRLKDDDLNNTISNELLPSLTDVNITAADRFVRDPDIIESIDKGNIHVQTTTANIGTGYIAASTRYSVEDIISRGFVNAASGAPRFDKGLLDYTLTRNKAKTGSYRVKERPSPDPNRPNDVYLRNGAGVVKGYGDFKDFVEEMPQMSFVKQLLTPVITEYKPYSWGYPQSDRRRFTANRDSDTRFDTMLVPDFKILDGENDFQKDGSFIRSFQYTVASDDDSWHAQYRGKTHKVNVFVCKPSPSSAIAYNEKFTDKADTTSYNQSTGGLPGVVLKLQLFNHEKDGVPLFCYGGNLTAQMVGEKVLVNPWGVILGEDTKGISTQSINESLQGWINSSKIPSHTTRVSTDPLNSDSLSNVRNQTGPVNPPCTWKQIYLTYDYGETRYQNYFRDVHMISSVENKGKSGIKKVLFVKKHDESYKSSAVNYTRFVNNNMSVATIAPVTDQAYEQKGYYAAPSADSEPITFTGPVHAGQVDFWNDIVGTQQTKTQFKDNAGHYGLGTAALTAYKSFLEAKLASSGVYQVTDAGQSIAGILGDSFAYRAYATFRLLTSGYQTSQSKRNVYYAFHDFTVPDVISCLGKTFEKIEEPPSVTTVQNNASSDASYILGADPLINDSAFAYISLRFLWPWLGASDTAVPYKRSIYHVALNWNDVKPFGSSPDLSDSYGSIPSFYSATGGSTLAAPWNYKTGTAVPATFAQIQCGHSFPTWSFLGYRNEPVNNLSARFGIRNGGDLFLSQRDSTLRPDSKHLMTNIVEEYFAKYNNMRAYTKKFILGTNTAYKYTVHDIKSSPTQLTLLRPDFVEDDVRRVTGTSQGDIYLSADESVRSVEGGVADPKGTKTLADTGASSNLVVDGNYIVFSGRGRAYQFRQSEEAKGYLQNIINEEFEFPDKNINTVVSLFARHRIFLFHQEGSKNIYVLSASTDRKVNGISVLVMPSRVQTIKQNGSDEIIMQTGGTLSKMNFSADRNTVYKDFIPGGDPKTFDVSLTTLPVFVLTDTESSVFYRTSIPRAVVTLEGYPEFTMDVINQENKVIASRSLRKVGRDVSKTPYFSGAFLIDRLPTSATEQPRVRIRKNSENYIAFSSMVLDLGSTKRDTIGGKRRD